MIGYRTMLTATAGWIARCLNSPWLPRVRQVVSHAGLARLWSKFGPGAGKSVFPPLSASASAPALSFRCLEPRRVLSVNAVFAAGVLEVTIQDDGGNVDAALLSDDGMHFFVDADGDQVFDDGTSDPLELRGLLSDLTRINVLGDAGVGTFAWRDNFSAAMLSSSAGTNAVDVSDVLSVNLSSIADVAGDVSVTAGQSIQFGGDLAIVGDLTASTTLATGMISGNANGSLEVTGNAHLSADDISLGVAAGDHLAVGSFTVNATGDVAIAEDGSAGDPDTLLIGSNTAAKLSLSSDGSVTLASSATLTTDADVQLNATGTMNNIRIDGLVTSTAGDITLHAGQQVALGNMASITTAGPGEIALTADGSGIALADGSELVTLDGAIRLTALDADGGNISLSQLTTGGGAGATVHILAAGNITDATAGEGVNILSPMGSLWLQSLGGSIGSAADDLNVDVQNLVFDAGAATFGIVHISDLAGGLRISGPSRAAAGAVVTAHSPLTIAADLNVGASSTFTAGNSAAAGDNLTIENSAIVTLTALLPATLTFNAGDDILFRDAGRVVTSGTNLHTVTLSADLDHDGLGAADGDRGSISQDATAVVEVTTNRLIARAAEGIDLNTQIDNLDAWSTVLGDIVIGEVDSITLDLVRTGDGAIEIMANGTVAAVNVDSSGTDSDDNDVRITTTSGDVIVKQIRAGSFHGDVVVDAHGNILDGDSGPDDVDIEANDVILVAQTGNIGVPAGLFFKDRPDAVEVVTSAHPAFPLEPGNLSATALTGSIAVDMSVAGTASFTTNTLFVTSAGDLDVSTAIFTVTNLALIADADDNGVGTLTFGPTLAVVGDMRLEGANITTVGPLAPQLDLAANRLLFRSLAQADIRAAVQVVDATAQGDLTIRATLATIELVDLNCDNIALQTTDSAGSILLESSGTLTVADDILAGNDGLTTSTGAIEFSFAVGAMGDILIHDSMLTDQGNISLMAPGSIRLQQPVVADPLDEDGMDNLPLIATIDGVITLVADTDGDGGGIFMADMTRIVAGREAVNYVPGSDGLASPTPPTLGGIVKGPGQAQIELTATDSITLASLQSTNNTSAAVRVTSTAGAIVDGGDADVDIVANQAGAVVTLSARNGIGSLNAIETAVAQIDVRNLGPTGNIGIHEVAAGGPLRSLAALNTASGGSVLLTTDNGSLHIEGVGVTAIDGHVTLLASNDLHVQSSISTTGSGDIYLAAGNAAVDAVPPQVDGLTIDAGLATDMGSILLQSQQDLRATAAITSNQGVIGLTATRDILLSAGSSTTADILVDAGRHIAMAAPASLAGNNILLAAGSSLGIAAVTGNHVALTAGLDITDTNAGAANVTATTLQMAAGGTIGQADVANGLPDVNLNALDIAVDTVAALSGAGIYLQQLSGGGDLFVGSIGNLQVSATAEQVAANGSTLSVTAQQEVAGQDRLSTNTGPIKVRVESGNLTIGGGGVAASGGGDVLLWALHDAIIGSAVTSDSGHVTLQAGDDLVVNAAVSTAGVGSLTLWANNANAADAVPANVDGISLNSDLSTTGGSILLNSAFDIRANATVTSATADLGGVEFVANVGLVASRHITQLANLTSAGDVLVDAGGNFSMTATSQLNAGGNVLSSAGQSIELGAIAAARVWVVAGQNIVNVSGIASANVTASSLSMLAGGTIGVADLANGTPDLNSNAINIVTDTLAARAGVSMYVQQLAVGGNLSIDSVAAVDVSVAVTQARFNSTTTNVVATAHADARDDLSSDSGPIKLAVRDGSLTINDGSLGGGVGVLAAGAGDALLWAANDITIAAVVDGGSGHVTIQAGDDLAVNAAVRSTGTGTIYLHSGNSAVGDAVGLQSDGLRVAGPLTADSSILLSSQGNLDSAANITSGGGNVGLLASGNITQAANLVATTGNVLVSAGGTFTQSGTLTAAADALISSGGTITLGLVTANQLSLVTDGDILDGNGLDALNVRANSLSMIAGGIIGGSDLMAAADVNAAALDINVATIAARSRDGIYLQQLAAAGDLTVDLVTGATPVSVAVNQVRFNSTLTAIAASQALPAHPMADLETDQGPIKLVVRAGSLTLNDGDGDGRSVVAGGNGDVLLQAVSGLTANASITSGTGDVTLIAGGQLDLNAVVATGGGGAIYLNGASVAVDAVVNTQAGSLLVSAVDDLGINAVVASQTGSVGLLAGRDVLQNASVAAGRDLLLMAGRDVTQFVGTAQAGRTAQATAGESIRLNLIEASHVSLTAGQNILDNNGQDTLNIQATTLAATAGGIIGGADLANAANANAQAIDLAVSQLAARSTNGIYLQQLAAGGDLVIGHVQGSAGVEVNQVRFNSSRTPLTAGDVAGNQLLPLSDLETSSGPVKLVVTAGRLTVNDGGDADGIGVTAGTTGDVLLAASSDIVLSANVLSGSGHITTVSGRDLIVTATVQTGGDGSIYLSATNDQLLSGIISSQQGDLLLTAGRDVIHSGIITSQTGDLAVIASRDVAHSGTITAVENAFVQTGRDLSMGSGRIAAVENLLISSGDQVVNGNQQLGELMARNVLLNATGNIFDGNGASVNVTADNLRVEAYSLGTQDDPLDLSVGTLAADTTAGIYVRQLAGRPSLTVGHVEMAAAHVAIQQVNFNSSLAPLMQSLQLSALSDLETDRPQTGIESAIEVNVLSGDLIITDGQDADASGVLVTNTGSIQLGTITEGNIAIQTGIETRGLEAAGRITLAAADNILERPNLPLGNVSDAKVIGDSLVLQAGGFAHLHDVSVNSLQATVGANGLLDGVWQKTNALANDRGDDFLNQLGTGRPVSAEIALQFRFEDTYLRDYALFLQNSRTLDVQQVVAGNPLIPMSASPTVYIESIGASANLIVSGSVETHSMSDREGGIVLVAGGELDMQGSLATSAILSNSITRTQRIDSIGNLPTTDALGQAAIGYLNARTFNGGEGISPGHTMLTSTQFVIRDQVFGLSAANENYRTHVFQRVVAQYGFAGEAGFVTYVGYADGKVQQFEVTGETGARLRQVDPRNPDDQSALLAVPRDSGTATAFSRDTAFDPQFLDANQNLPTTAIIRRAADFFLFEHAASADAEDIRDMTVESFDVQNVYTFGARGALDVPRDPPPMQPPVFGLAVFPEILLNPTQLVRNDIELAAISERAIEVAIYRVYYDDLNLNGQADDSELPSEEQILSAEVAEPQDEEAPLDEMPKGQRRKLETVKTASGGSPTAEDIEALKEKFLYDPERPSGAYSIIEKGLDDKETVLDIFSVRDREQAGDSANDQPLVRPPTAEEVQQQQQQQRQRDVDGQSELPPVQPTDGASHPPSNRGLTEELLGTSGQAESRFAHAGLIASSLWLVRLQTQVNAATASGTSQPQEGLVDLREAPCDFTRRGRRSRRWQRRKSK